MGGTESFCAARFVCSACEQCLKLFLCQGWNAELLRFCQLAPGFFTDDQIVCLFCHRGCRNRADLQKLILDAVARIMLQLAGRHNDFAVLIGVVSFMN